MKDFVHPTLQLSVTINSKTSNPHSVYTYRNMIGPLPCDGAVNVNVTDVLRLLLLCVTAD